MNTRRNSAVFIHIFSIFDKIFVIFAKICKNSVIDFIYKFIAKDRGERRNFSMRFLWLEFMTNFLNFILFLKNLTKLAFLSPLALKLLEVDSLKLLPYSSYARKRGSCSPAGCKSLLEL